MPTSTDFHPTNTNKTVFVVHGRNRDAKNAMFQFLRALGLEPLTWRAASRLTDKTLPTNLEVVTAGMNAAQAAVILFTPDEVVGLRTSLLSPGDPMDSGFQPRPNVILEAGMATVMGRDRTILVHVGKIRPISDFDGHNYIEMTNDAESRQALIMCLQTAGCDVEYGEDFADPKVAGDFSLGGVEDQQRYLLDVSVVEKGAIYEAGVNYLKQAHRGEVLIYAPTGVWKPSVDKAKWFKAISLALLKRQYPNGDALPPALAKEIQSFPSKLRNFIGVYGLPPMPVDGDEEARNRYGKLLAGIEKLFAPFAAAENAHLYYLPVDTRHLPGSGVILIDDSIFVGFAVSGQYQVDYGLFIEHHQIASDIRPWFRNHVMSLAAPNVLQDLGKGISLKDGMNSLREKMNCPRTKA